MRVIFFFSKCSKFNLDFKNAAKNSEKVFCFIDNYIWIGISKLSLLRTGYFLSAANMLTSSRKNCHVNKRDFSVHNLLASAQWIWSRWCDADFNSVWASLSFCLLQHPLKRDFLNIYLTTFSQSLTLKIQKLWETYFFQNVQTFR